MIIRNMKKLLIILSISLSFPMFLRAQNFVFSDYYDSIARPNLQVLYQMTYHEDSTQMERYDEEMSVLLLGNKISAFQSYGSFRLTQLQRRRSEEGSWNDWYLSELSDFTTRFMYTIYKNFPKGKITVTDHVFLTGNFLYEEDMDSMDWNLMDDTLRIEDYLCQKAVCRFGGRVWTAWYTDELPFSDGPYKFHGLPGLILKVTDATGSYCYEFVSIEVPDPKVNIVWNLNDYTKTTKKGFFHVEDECRENIISHFDEHTGIEAQRKAFGVMQSRNNPIELERK